MRSPQLQIDLAHGESGTRQLEAVIFDNDGLFVDTQTLWKCAQERLFAHHDVPYGAPVRINRRAWSAIERFADEDQVSVRLLTIEARHDHGRVGQDGSS